MKLKCWLAITFTISLASSGHSIAACTINASNGMDCTAGSNETFLGIRIVGDSSTKITGSDITLTGFTGFGDGGNAGSAGSNYVFLIEDSTINTHSRFLDMGRANNIDFKILNSTLNVKLVNGAASYAVNFWRTGSGNTFTFENLDINSNFRTNIFEGHGFQDNNYYIKNVRVNTPSDVGWLLGGSNSVGIFDGLTQLDSLRTTIAVEKGGLSRLSILNSEIRGRNSLGAIFWSANPDAKDEVTDISIEKSIIDVSDHTEGRGIILPTVTAVDGHKFRITFIDSKLITDKASLAMMTDSKAEISLNKSSLIGIQNFEKDLIYVANDSTIEGVLRANDASGNFISQTTLTNTKFSGEYRGGSGTDRLNILARTLINDAILDGGADALSSKDTLTFQNSAHTLNGAKIVNWEQIVIDGSSLSFTDDQLSIGSPQDLGLSIINAGALNARGTFVLSGNLNTSASGIFRGLGGGTGSYTIQGNVLNNGFLTTRDGKVGDVIRVTGSYQGSGQIEADVDFANERADRLVVSGDVSGATKVLVNDVSTSDGSDRPILLIEVSGNSAVNAFSLADGPVNSGAYSYSLGKIGQNWFLSRGGLSTFSPVYEAYPRFLVLANDIQTYAGRTGGRTFSLNQSNTRNQETSIETKINTFSDIWLDVEQVNTRTKAETSTTNATVQSSSWKLRGGIDKEVFGNQNGTLVAGLNFHHVIGNAQVTSGVGDGNIHLNGKGIGATLTWHDDDGLYVDGQAQVTSYQSDLTSERRGSLVKGNRGSGYGLSLEVGKHLNLTQNWSVTPQAQLKLSSINFNNFSGPNSEQVKRLKGHDVKTRIGAIANYQQSLGNWKTNPAVLNLSIGTNIYRELSTEVATIVSGETFVNRLPSTSGELIASARYTDLGKNLSLFARASYATTFSTNFAENYKFSAKAGAHFRW